MGIWSTNAPVGEPAPAARGGAVDVVDAVGLVAHQVAPVELDDPSAHLVDHAGVVGGDDHRGPGPVDPVEQAHDAEAGRGVEVPGGLVGQEDQRAVDEGPGHRHPLLLATGQLAGQVVALLGQADQVEDLGHLGGDHVLGPADHLEGEGDVLEDGLVGQEAEVLEDAADVAAEVGDAPLGQVADLLARLPDAPGVGHLLAQEEPDERGLAGARRADQEDELTLVDLYGAVVAGRPWIPCTSW